MVSGDISTVDKDVIDVGIGELAVARAPQRLATAALGSCVGLAVWDPFDEAGGLAHVMLPQSGDSRGPELLTRFAGYAVPLLIEKLEHQGSPRHRLVAKIVGGAAMFAADAAMASIGERNVEEVRKLLKLMRVRIVAEDVGGDHARTIEFRLDSGVVVVKSYAYGIKEL